jgi:hypothetical protein
MRISQNELNQFVDFLRAKCKVQQITSYIPQPNEQGEFFRAVCEGHLLIAHVLEPDQLCIITDDQYQLALWTRWTEYKKLTLKPTSVYAALKSLLVGGRRLEPSQPVFPLAVGNKLAEGNAVTIDLPRK